jgi:hypothetical protein
LGIDGKIAKQGRKKKDEVDEIIKRRETNRSKR